MRKISYKYISDMSHTSSSYLFTYLNMGTWKKWRQFTYHWDIFAERCNFMVHNFSCTTFMRAANYSRLSCISIYMYITNEWVFVASCTHVYICSDVRESIGCGTAIKFPQRFDAVRIALGKFIVFAFFDK